MQGFLHTIWIQIQSYAAFPGKIAIGAGMFIFSSQNQRDIRGLVVSRSHYHYCHIFVRHRFTILTLV